jgi:hypothetical protein
MISRATVLRLSRGNRFPLLRIIPSHHRWRRPFETDQRSRSEPFMHHSADMRARIRNWPLLKREIAALCDSRATGGRDETQPSSPGSTGRSSTPQLLGSKFSQAMTFGVCGASLRLSLRADGSRERARWQAPRSNPSGNKKKDWIASSLRSLAQTLHVCRRQ